MMAFLNFTVATWNDGLLYLVHILLIVLLGALRLICNWKVCGKLMCLTRVDCNYAVLPRLFVNNQMCCRSVPLVDE